MHRIGVGVLLALIHAWTVCACREAVVGGSVVFDPQSGASIYFGGWACLEDVSDSKPSNYVCVQPCDGTELQFLDGGSNYTPPQTTSQCCAFDPSSSQMLCAIESQLYRLNTANGTWLKPFPLAPPTNTSTIASSTSCAVSNGRFYVSSNSFYSLDVMNGTLKSSYINVPRMRVGHVVVMLPSEQLLMLFGSVLADLSIPITQQLPAFLFDPTTDEWVPFESTAPDSVKKLSVGVSCTSWSSLADPVGGVFCFGGLDLQLKPNPHLIYLNLTSNSWKDLGIPTSMENAGTFGGTVSLIDNGSALVVRSGGAINGNMFPLTGAGSVTCSKPDANNGSGVFYGIPPLGPGSCGVPGAPVCPTTGPNAPLIPPGWTLPPFPILNGSTIAIKTPSKPSATATLVVLPPGSTSENSNGNDGALSGWKLGLAIGIPLALLFCCLSMFVLRALCFKKPHAGGAQPIASPLPSNKTAGSVLTADVIYNRGIVSDGIPYPTGTVETPNTFATGAEGGTVASSSTQPVHTTAARDLGGIKNIAPFMAPFSRFGTAAGGVFRKRGERVNMMQTRSSAGESIQISSAGDTTLIGAAGVASSHIPSKGRDIGPETGLRHPGQSYEIPLQPSNDASTEIGALSQPLVFPVAASVAATSIATASIISITSESVKERVKRFVVACNKKGVKPNTRQFEILGISKCSAFDVERALEYFVECGRRNESVDQRVIDDAMKAGYLDVNRVQQNLVVEAIAGPPLTQDQILNEMKDCLKDVGSVQIFLAAMYPYCEEPNVTDEQADAVMKRFVKDANSVTPTSTFNVNKFIDRVRQKHVSFGLPQLLPALQKSRAIPYTKHAFASDMTRSGAPLSPTEFKDCTVALCGSPADIPPVVALMGKTVKLVGPHHFNRYFSADSNSGRFSNTAASLGVTSPGASSKSANRISRGIFGLFRMTKPAPEARTEAAVLPDSFASVPEIPTTVEIPRSIEATYGDAFTADDTVLETNDTTRAIDENLVVIPLIATRSDSDQTLTSDVGEGSPPVVNSTEDVVAEDVNLQRSRLHSGANQTAAETVREMEQVDSALYSVLRTGSVSSSEQIEPTESLPNEDLTPKPIEKLYGNDYPGDPTTTGSIELPNDSIPGVGTANLPPIQNNEPHESNHISSQNDESSDPEIAIVGFDTERVDSQQTLLHGVSPALLKLRPKQSEHETSQDQIPHSFSDSETKQRDIVESNLESAVSDSVDGEALIVSKDNVNTEEHSSSSENPHSLQDGEPKEDNSVVNLNVNTEEHTSSSENPHSLQDGEPKEDTSVVDLQSLIPDHPLQPGPVLNKSLDDPQEIFSPNDEAQSLQDAEEKQRDLGSAADTIPDQVSPLFESQEDTPDQVDPLPKSQEDTDNTPDQVGALSKSQENAPELEGDAPQTEKSHNVMVDETKPQDFTDSLQNPTADPDLPPSEDLPSSQTMDNMKPAESISLIKEDVDSEPISGGITWKEAIPAGLLAVAAVPLLLLAAGSKGAETSRAADAGSRDQTGDTNIIAGLQENTGSSPKIISPSKKLDSPLEDIQKGVTGSNAEPSEPIIEADGMPSTIPSSDIVPVVSIAPEKRARKVVKITKSAAVKPDSEPKAEPESAESILKDGVEPTESHARDIGQSNDQLVDSAVGDSVLDRSMPILDANIPVLESPDRVDPGAEIVSEPRRKPVVRITKSAASKPADAEISSLEKSVEIDVPETQPSPHQQDVIEETPNHALAVAKPKNGRKMVKVTKATATKQMEVGTSDPPLSVQSDEIQSPNEELTITAPTAPDHDDVRDLANEKSVQPTPGTDGTVDEAANVGKVGEPVKSQNRRPVVRITKAVAASSSGFNSESPSTEITLVASHPNVQDVGAVHVDVGDKNVEIKETSMVEHEPELIPAKQARRPVIRVTKATVAKKSDFDSLVEEADPVTATFTEVLPVPEKESLSDEKSSIVTSHQENIDTQDFNARSQSDEKTGGPIHDVDEQLVTTGIQILLPTTEEPTKESVENSTEQPLQTDRNLVVEEAVQSVETDGIPTVREEIVIPALEIENNLAPPPKPSAKKRSFFKATFRQPPVSTATAPLDAVLLQEESKQVGTPVSPLQEGNSVDTLSTSIQPTVQDPLVTNKSSGNEENNTLSADTAIEETLPEPFIKEIIELETSGNTHDHAEPADEVAVVSREALTKAKDSESTTDATGYSEAKSPDQPNQSNLEERLVQPQVLMLKDQETIRMSAKKASVLSFDLGSDESEQEEFRKLKVSVPAPTPKQFSETRERLQRAAPSGWLSRMIKNLTDVAPAFDFSKFSNAMADIPSFVTIDEEVIRAELSECGAHLSDDEFNDLLSNINSANPKSAHVAFEAISEAASYIGPDVFVSQMVPQILQLSKDEIYWIKKIRSSAPGDWWPRFLRKIGQYAPEFNLNIFMSKLGSAPFVFGTGTVPLSIIKDEHILKAMADSNAHLSPSEFHQIKEAIVPGKPLVATNAFRTLCDAVHTLGIRCIIGSVLPGLGMWVADRKYDTDTVSIISRAGSEGWLSRFLRRMAESSPSFDINRFALTMSNQPDDIFTTERSILKDLNDCGATLSENDISDALSSVSDDPEEALAAFKSLGIAYSEAGDPVLFMREILPASLHPTREEKKIIRRLQGSAPPGWWSRFLSGIRSYTPLFDLPEFIIRLSRENPNNLDSAAVQRLLAKSKAPLSKIELRHIEDQLAPGQLAVAIEAYRSLARCIQEIGTPSFIGVILPIMNRNEGSKAKKQRGVKPSEQIATNIVEVLSKPEPPVLIHKNTDTAQEEVRKVEEKSVAQTPPATPLPTPVLKSHSTSETDLMDAYNLLLQVAPTGWLYYMMSYLSNVAPSFDLAKFCFSLSEIPYYVELSHPLIKKELSNAGANLTDAQYRELCASINQQHPSDSLAVFEAISAVSSQIGPETFMSKLIPRLCHLSVEETLWVKKIRGSAPGEWWPRFLKKIGEYSPEFNLQLFVTKLGELPLSMITEESILKSLNASNSTLSVTQFHHVKEAIVPGKPLVAIGAFKTMADAVHKLGIQQVSRCILPALGMWVAERKPEAVTVAMLKNAAEEGWFTRFLRKAAEIAPPFNVVTFASEIASMPDGSSTNANQLGSAFTKAGMSVSDGDLASIFSAISPGNPKEAKYALRVLGLAFRETASAELFASEIVPASLTPSAEEVEMLLRMQKCAPHGWWSRFLATLHSLSPSFDLNAFLILCAGTSASEINDTVIIELFARTQAHLTNHQFNALCEQIYPGNGVRAMDAFRALAEAAKVIGPPSIIGVVSPLLLKPAKSKPREIRIIARKPVQSGSLGRNKSPVASDRPLPDHQHSFSDMVQGIRAKSPSQNRPVNYRHSVATETKRNSVSTESKRGRRPSSSAGAVGRGELRSDATASTSSSLKPVMGSGIPRATSPRGSLFKSFSPSPRTSADISRSMLPSAAPQAAAPKNQSKAYAAAVLSRKSLSGAERSPTPTRAPTPLSATSSMPIKSVWVASRFQAPENNILAMKLAKTYQASLPCGWWYRFVTFIQSLHPGFDALEFISELSRIETTITDERSISLLSASGAPLSKSEFESAKLAMNGSIEVSKLLGIMASVARSTSPRRLVQDILPIWSEAEAINTASFNEGLAHLRSRYPGFKPNVYGFIEACEQMHPQFKVFRFLDAFTAIQEPFTDAKLTACYKYAGLVASDADCQSLTEILTGFRDYDALPIISKGFAGIGVDSFILGWRDVSVPNNTQAKHSAMAWVSGLAELGPKTNFDPAHFENECKNLKRSFTLSDFLERLVQGRRESEMLDEMDIHLALHGAGVTVSDEQYRELMIAACGDFDQHTQIFKSWRQYVAVYGMAAYFEVIGEVLKEYQEKTLLVKTFLNRLSSVSSKSQFDLRSFIACCQRYNPRFNLSSFCDAVLSTPRIDAVSVNAAFQASDILLDEGTVEYRDILTALFGDFALAFSGMREWQYLLKNLGAKWGMMFMWIVIHQRERVEASVHALRREIESIPVVINGSMTTIRFTLGRFVEECTRLGNSKFELKILLEQLAQLPDQGDIRGELRNVFARNCISNLNEAEYERLIGSIAGGDHMSGLVVLKVFIAYLKNWGSEWNLWIVWSLVNTKEFNEEPMMMFTERVHEIGPMAEFNLLSFMNKAATVTDNDTVFLLDRFMEALISVQGEMTIEHIEWSFKACGIPARTEVYADLAKTLSGGSMSSTALPVFTYWASFIRRWGILWFMHASVPFFDRLENAKRSLKHFDFVLAETGNSMKLRRFIWTCQTKYGGFNVKAFLRHLSTIPDGELSFDCISDALSQQHIDFSRTALTELIQSTTGASHEEDGLRVMQQWNITVRKIGIEYYILLFKLDGMRDVSHMDADAALAIQAFRARASFSCSRFSVPAFVTSVRALQANWSILTFLQALVSMTGEMTYIRFQDVFQVTGLQVTLEETTFLLSKLSGNVDTALSVAVDWVETARYAGVQNMLEADGFSNKSNRSSSSSSTSSEGWFNRVVRVVATSAESAVNAVEDLMQN
ncbi:hypothetical protein CcCBS67573_g05872 [Chytriomyces confervae]|uniref:Uncharacterized protein n=1 Tax=Chytriomyces confervae TaxID=246404 RepID=A0A507FAU7_9FUNG|nr:hypothetical protein CcCBS67573_g05872 [Chytriomyces confervae]